MQKVVFTCDHCKRVIGNNFHISMVFNKGVSGVAIPPMIAKSFEESVNRWRMSSVTEGSMQFHVVCVGKYFEKMAQRIIKDNFPESFKTKKDEKR